LGKSELKVRGGLIPGNAINAKSAAQTAAAVPSPARASFFDFPANQMGTPESMAGRGTYPMSESMSQSDDVG
jgi:hypothetical protein